MFGTATISIARIAGGLFNFLGADYLRTTVGLGAVTFGGYLGGALTESQGAPRGIGTLTSSFSAPIDELRIHVLSELAFDAWVDNIVIAADTTELDCNQNGIPDACEPDQDADAIPDDCDPCPTRRMGVGARLPDPDGGPTTVAVGATHGSPARAPLNPEAGCTIAHRPPASPRPAGRAIVAPDLQSGGSRP